MHTSTHLAFPICDDQEFDGGHRPPLFLHPTTRRSRPSDRGPLRTQGISEYRFSSTFSEHVFREPLLRGSFFREGPPDASQKLVVSVRRSDSRGCRAALGASRHRARSIREPPAPPKTKAPCPLQRRETQRSGSRAIRTSLPPSKVDLTPPRDERECSTARPWGRAGRRAGPAATGAHAAASLAIDDKRS